MITIIPPKGTPSTGCGTTVLNEDGTKISGIRHIQIDIGLDEPITARLEFVKLNTEQIKAIPMLSLESLKEMAEQYGMRLVDNDDMPLLNLDKISVQDSDVLVVRTPMTISRETGEAITSHIKKTFPRNEVAILDSGMELAVYDCSHCNDKRADRA